MEDDLRKSLQYQPHQEANEGLIQKRNGPSGSPGWGWKEVGGGWNRSTGNSPALSALALLGFMFFLNLIQTSLQNNRQMLAAAALNATTVGVVAGRSGVKLRYTRDTDYLNLKNRFMSEIPAVREREPIRRNEKFEQFPTTQHPFEFMRRGRPSSNSTSSDNLPIVIHGSSQNETLSTHTNENENPVEDFKSTSLECFQLLACKIGHSIYGSLDSTTGLIVRMLGASVVPRLPRATWSGRLMRAFNKGWRNGKVCEKLYTKCHLLDILAFNTTRFPPVVRRRKSKEQLRRNYWYK
ncbi:unnamed protein product [Orchesella dallaii]|uniref:Uncharacterized protein n=1 Tax=Orchesella dallaii TaxID=48710 RepID=A0ABP1QTX9_9HEXA